MGNSPRGLASGALAGQYPNPALGLVSAAGISLVDDFLLEAGTVSSRYGSLLWRLTAIAGSPTVASITPTASTEAGLLELTLPASSGDAGVIHLGSTVPPIYRTLPNGTIWCAKFRMTTGASAYELWAGFSDSFARVNSSSNDFIGVRSVGANLFGLVRNNTTELTVDLGIDCESAYKTVGFEIIDGSAQFFTLDCTDDAIFERTDVGDPQAISSINEDLYPIALGLYTSDAAAKVAVIDLWAMGGRCAR